MVKLNKCMHICPKVLSFDKNTNCNWMFYISMYLLYTVHSVHMLANWMPFNMYNIVSEQNNQFLNHVHDFLWLYGHPILSQSLKFHCVVMTLTAYYHIFESNPMGEKIALIGQVIYVRDWHLITTGLTFWLLPLTVASYCHLF